MLREQTYERLRRFTDDMKSAARVSDNKQLNVREPFTRFDQHLEYSLRQFDVGYHDGPEPEVPMADNSINVTGNLTGNIQQNSPGATQNFQFNLIVQAAQTALQAFESELSKTEIDDRTRQDLAADIATIKAQLAKPAPGYT